MFDIIYDVALIVLVILWSVTVPVKLLPYAKRNKDHPLVAVISIVLVFAMGFVGLLLWDLASHISLT